MNRRNFLTSMLAACAAPAIVRADSLMRIVARDATVFRPYDFTGEMQQLVSGGRLNVGDVFTMAGIDGKFVVQSVITSGYELRSLA